MNQSITIFISCLFVVLGCDEPVARSNHSPHIADEMTGGMGRASTGIMNTSTEISSVEESPPSANDPLLESEIRDSHIDEGGDSNHFETDAHPSESPRTCTVHILKEIHIIEEEQTITLNACEKPRLHLVLPANTQWSFEVEIPQLVEHENQPNRESTPLSLWVYDSRYWLDSENRTHLTSNELSINQGLINFNSGYGGEHIIELQQDGEVWSSQLTETLQITLRCLSGCRKKTTRYPIIFVHGYAGVDQYFGVIDYFYRLPSTLTQNGFHTYFPSVSPIATSEERASELLVFIDQIQAATGARQFNMIAHSQGGIDVRYLISSLGQGDKIRSLTTIASPHRGIPIQTPSFISPQDFSIMAMEQFNQDNPADSTVQYFSWSARTCSAINLECLSNHEGEIVSPFLVLSFVSLNAYGPNDGIIPTSSMLYGEHLGQLNADHFDEIGQIADQLSGPFDHLAFYLSEANRLRSLGF